MSASRCRGARSGHALDASAARRPASLERIVFLLHRSGRLSTSNAFRLFDSLLLRAKSPKPPSIASFNLLLLAAAAGRSRQRPPAAAVTLFARLTAVVAPSVYTYGILMERCSRAGRVDLSLAFLGRMVKTGVAANSTVFTSLLAGLCAAQRVGEALEIAARRMPEMGCEADVYVCNVLLKGLCGGSAHLLALDLLQWMREEGGELCGPDVLSYNTVIDGFCNVGRIDEAFDLLGDMPAAGIVPDVVTCNTVMKGLCKDGRTDEAFELLDDMNVTGVMPNVVTYSTLLNGLCKKGMPDRGIDLLLKMQSAGIEPNVLTYNAIVKGLCDVGRHELVLKLLRLMAKGREQCKPNRISYGIAIEGLRKADKMEEVFQLMRDSPITANAHTYNAAIESLCSAGRISEALALFDDMRIVGVEPENITCSTILKELCRSGNHGAALKRMRWIAREHGDGRGPDAASYGVVIDGLCTDGKSDDAVELINEMRLADVAPSIDMYMTVVDSLCDGGESEVRGALVVLQQEASSKERTSGFE